jgi:hypothetical protein
MDFVVGHPRSGTFFITELLNAGGEMVCAHELLVKLTNHELVPKATEYYQRRTDAEAIRRLLKAYDGAPAIRIDSNWKLTWILPVLLDAYPDARYVHLVRDPRENVRSCDNLDYYGELATSPVLKAYAEQSPPDVRAFMEDLAQWYRAMPRVDCENWDSMTRFERNCAFWTESQELVLRTIPGRAKYLRFRSEDVADDSAVANLFEFLGVTPPEQTKLDETRSTLHHDFKDVKSFIGQLRDDLLPPVASWPETLRETTRRLCGNTAVRLGYEI